MRFLTIALASLLATGLVTGCTAPAPTEDAVSSDEALTTDQRGYDVTVLQAWIGKSVGRRYSNGYQLGDLALDLSRCSGDDCLWPASDGNGGSLYRRSYALRPYAQFDIAGTDTTYRNWDQVATDHVLGRNGSDWTQSFDRQGELLQP